MSPETTVLIVRTLMRDLMPTLEMLARQTTTPIDDITLRVLSAVLDLTPRPETRGFADPRE